MATDMHPNVEQVAAFLDAFFDADATPEEVETAVERCRPDLVFHVLGRETPFAGRYEGLDEVFSTLNDMVDVTEGTWHATGVGAYAAGDELVTLHLSEESDIGGYLGQGDVAVIARVVDGRIAEMFWITDAGLDHHWGLLRATAEAESSAQVAAPAAGAQPGAARPAKAPVAPAPPPVEEPTRAFVKVARSEDLRAIEGLDTELFEVAAGDDSVVIGRRANGEVVAFAQTCPHEGTDLAQATFVDGMIRCPRHNYLYDPQTGENVVPFRISPPESMWKLHPGYLPTYSVEERDGWVWVATKPGPPPKVWDPELEVRPTGADRQVVPPPAAKETKPAGPVVAEPEHMEVDLSEAFELELPMDNAPPAHAWNIEATEDILTVLEKRLEMEPTPHLRVRIVTRELGQGMVTCTFGRPWDTTPAEIRKYIVDVAVRT